METTAKRKKEKEKEKRKPGRPPKPPGEKVRLSLPCQTTCPPEIIAWLEQLGDGSRHTGIGRVVREAYRRATGEAAGP